MTTQSAQPDSGVEVRPVALVMLTWNALRFTQKCIESLRSNTSHADWRLIVVDNGSTDGTVAYLNAQPDLHVICNATNTGFTHAVNQGIAATRPDEDVVLVNNDMMFSDPLWLDKLQDAAYEADDIGIVGGRLTDQTGALHHIGAVMPPRTIMGHQIGGDQLDINQATQRFDVEAIIFALAYIKRGCLNAVGVLDEDLFAYFEDSEFCLRARQAGWRTRLAGDVQAVHFHNTSTKENNVDFWAMYLKSRETFRSKYGQWLEHDRYVTSARWNSVLTQPLGYAQVSNHMLRALHYSGVRMTYSNAYDQGAETVSDSLMVDLLDRPTSKNETVINLCQADYFGHKPGKRQIGWSMLEVTGLPADWTAACNKMDEVWVPTAFNVETFRNAGVTRPIEVMPLGVDVRYFNPAITGVRVSKSFTFLSVFEWGERKAPELLLKAYAQEFSAADDVVLLLSVFNRDKSIDVAAEVRKLVGDNGPRVAVMINAEIAAYQMGSLYRSADAFVLTTRGEGWGQPVLEAMASGLPTIATNWSAHASFLTQDTGYPIDIDRLVDAEARCPYYEGWQWAQPSVEHTQALMREVFEKRESAQAKGLAAAEWVANNLTWDMAANRVRDRLVQLA